MSLSRESLVSQGFEPLPKIIFSDDFDEGYNGWITLMPNFRQDTFAYYDSFKGWTAWGPPMLSSATFPYAGTHGSMHGTYSLKLATRPISAPAEKRPVAGSMGMAIKRLTHRTNGLLKCEMWYSFTAEQSIPGIGEEAIRAFGFFWDVSDDENRTFYGARYLNSANGKMQQHWQLFKVDPTSTLPWGFEGESAPGEPNGSKVTLSRGIDTQWLGNRNPDGTSDGYFDIPGSGQKMCYNETPDKINWHYFSFTVDLDKREYVELCSVNRKFDLRGVGATSVPRYPRTEWLLNPVLFIETDSNRRVFLYVDSIVNSTT
ncbi:MAG: DUF6772 family protein [Sphaerochaetaceae bacterium]